MGCTGSTIDLKLNCIAIYNQVFHILPSSEGLKSSILVVQNSLTFLFKM